MAHARANQTALISNHHAYPADDDTLRVERVQLQLSDMVNSMIGCGRAASCDLLNSRPAHDLGLVNRTVGSAHRTR